MSLRWDTKNVKNGAEVCFVTATEDAPMHGVKKGEQVLNPVTWALIWHSLGTGIGTITKENASEVYARISFIEAIHGPSLRNQDGPQPITVADVFDHVGLYTNASYKTESRTSFLKRQAVAYLDDSKRRYERIAATVAA